MNEVHASIQLEAWPYPVPTQMLEGQLEDEISGQLWTFSIMAMPTGRLLLILREETNVSNLVSEPLVFKAGDTLPIQCKVLEGGGIGVFAPYPQLLLVDAREADNLESQVYSNWSEIREDVVNTITLKRFSKYAFPNRRIYDLKNLSLDMLEYGISMSDLVDAYQKLGYFLPEIDLIWARSQGRSMAGANETPELLDAANSILMLLTLFGKYSAVAYGTRTNFGRYAYGPIAEAKKRLISLSD